MRYKLHNLASYRTSSTPLLGKTQKDIIWTAECPTKSIIQVLFEKHKALFSRNHPKVHYYGLPEVAKMVSVLQDKK
jgi:hypothetical protein